jgi:hypothetical protein
MKLLGFLLIWISSLTTAIAQESINTSGTSSTSSSGSISYSIGQVVYTSASGTTGSINQGVQQPFEFEIITGVEHTEIEMAVFPNPAVEQLQLNISSTNIENYSIQLFDARGKLVMSNSKIQPINTIPVVDFMSGIYFLSVYEYSTLVKSYRIVRP